MWWKLVLGYALVLLSAPQLFFWPIALGTIGVMLMVSATLESHQRRAELRTNARPVVDKPPMSARSQYTIAVVFFVVVVVAAIAVGYQP